ncbi:hypothetical protein G5V57_23120 [Nordella sp. HKS 07]|uniref:DUF6506 family protein n=1 Tax=Nordella sp. HKS 07 TaxID=2712222 RepID=UPI0013E1AC7F|nr:DUF6506 family protein [Nordella sp. HKS 07]QIG50364.1 hypothetical protein G5V57_23120 [Nordella sp. HKS 07]
MTKFAVIYESPRVGPEGESIDIEKGANKVTIVTVAEPSHALAWAKTLVTGGARRIELCGSMSPIWRDKVSRAVDGAVPVSSVTFGFESIRLAAAFSANFEAGKDMKDAFIIRLPGADAQRDRTVQKRPPQISTLIAVPDAAGAVAAAREMVAAGVELIELYGFDTQDAASVIAAVEGRVAVGVGSFGLEVARGRNSKFSA